MRTPHSAGLGRERQGQISCLTFLPLLPPPQVPSRDKGQLPTRPLLRWRRAYGNPWG